MPPAMPRWRRSGASGSPSPRRGPSASGLRQHHGSDAVLLPAPPGHPGVPRLHAGDPTGVAAQDDEDLRALRAVADEDRHGSKSPEVFIVLSSHTGWVARVKPRNAGMSRWG